MNRKVIFPAVAFLFLIALTACLSRKSVVLPETMFRGDTARSGFHGSSGPDSLEGPKWIVRAGAPVLASPVVAGGVLYVGTDDGTLYALDKETGKSIWSFQSQGPVRSTPAVSEGRVFFGSSDGSFYALEAATGESLWEFATAGEKLYSERGLFGLNPADSLMPDPWDFFQSSPVVHEGRVIFGSGDGNVYALELATGREIWRFRTGGVVHASPAVAAGRVFVGGYDRMLYALDEADGHELWRFETGADPKGKLMCGIQGSPAVDSRAVYFGSRDGNFYALAVDSGRRLWSYSTQPSWVVDSPALSGNLVLFGTSDSGRFIGLDRATGELKFDFKAQMYVFSSPVATDRAVYFGGFNGRLYALSLPEGKPLWEFQTEGSRLDPSGVLQADGSLNRAAFAADSLPNYHDMLSVVGKLLAAGPVLSSPLIDNGVIFFGSADSCIYALH